MCSYFRNDAIGRIQAQELRVRDDKEGGKTLQIRLMSALVRYIYPPAPTRPMILHALLTGVDRVLRFGFVPTISEVGGK